MTSVCSCQGVTKGFWSGLLLLPALIFLGWTGNHFPFPS